MKKGRLLLGIPVILLAAFGVLQLIPYGRNHSNPPVAQDAPWPEAQSRAIARESCYDCHSNETTWPWYTQVAPFSWLIQRDVEEGRTRLNFSEWGTGEQKIEDAGETVLEGEMPPLQYLIIHSDARLSDTEKQTLLKGLQALGSREGERGELEEEED